MRAFEQVTILEVSPRWDGKDCCGCIVLSRMENTRVFFVNLVPPANWAHPCIYIVVQWGSVVSVNAHVHNMPPSKSGYDEDASESE